MLSLVASRLQFQKLAFTQRDVIAKLARALLEIVRSAAFNTVTHAPQFVLQCGQFLPKRPFDFHRINFPDLWTSTV
jgi:hypothetical protein